MISSKIKHICCETFISESTPVYIADTFFNTPKDVNMHDHDFYEFFLVKKGVLFHTLNNVMSPLPERTLCFIRPSDIHMFRNKPEAGPCIITNVAFPEKFFYSAIHYLQLSSQMIGSFRFFNNLSEWDVLAYNIDKLRQDDTSSNDKATIFRGLLCEVLLMLAPKHKEENNNLLDWLDSACSEIRKRDNYEKGIKRFVELSGKTQEHFTRVFRKRLNTCPTEYLNKIRLNEAANLLCSTDDQIIKISMDVGFGNLSYFNACFKSMFGMTPRDYRKRNRSIFSV